MTAEKISIQTMTGELFQSLRLYYKMHSKSGTLVAFNKLRCMNFDKQNDRWAWVYDGEAKKLEFERPWSSIPLERRPIVLGYFYSRVDHEMYLDVGSIERALAAVTFFDRHVKRKVAELTYVAVYNQLPTSQAEHPGYCFDRLFASVDTTKILQELREKTHRAAEMVNSGRLRDVINERNFDLVETFPANYYEEGLEYLKKYT
jgi:hypothetical protein